MKIICENCNKVLENTVRCPCGHRTVVEDAPDLVKSYLEKVKDLMKHDDNNHET